MRAFHVNSSLPRSGSELLQALLAQHPEVYASATSPLLEYWYGAQGNTGMAEVRSQDSGAMRAAFTAFCREGARGYYEALTDKPVVVDKSRGWLEHAETLWQVFPEARIVSMVREPKDIIASLERIYQANPGHPETRQLPRTPQERARYWSTPPNPPLGLALMRLQQRQAKGKDERIRYVNYDMLVNEPVAVMRQVFKHLQLDPIDIDPEHVEKAVAEDDSCYGIFGQHQLRPVVGRREDK